MTGSGIKASELIDALKKMIEKHGDCQVFSGGTDYPEGVHGVRHNKQGDGYTPSNTFTIG